MSTTRPDTSSVYGKSTPTLVAFNALSARVAAVSGFVTAAASTSAPAATSSATVSGPNTVASEVHAKPTVSYGKAGRSLDTFVMAARVAFS